MTYGKIFFKNFILWLVPFLKNFNCERTTCGLSLEWLFLSYAELFECRHVLLLSNGYPDCYTFFSFCGRFRDSSFYWLGFWLDYLSGSWFFCCFYWSFPHLPFGFCSWIRLPFWFWFRFHFCHFGKIERITNFQHKSINC